MSTQPQDLSTSPAPEVLEDLFLRMARKLQLSELRHRQTTERYKSIAEWLDEPGSSLARFSPLIYPQGSLRIGTTVHLKGTDEFDLDAVCGLSIDWTRVAPVAVLDAVESRLAENEEYRRMLERKNRCIRLVYANEFHVDVLPALPDPAAGGTCVRVPDRHLKDWVPSNPIGYADWFESRTKLYLAEKMAKPIPAPEPFGIKPILKVAVQLLKRWRDVRYETEPTRAPISIVLTTLAGQHYAAEQTPFEALSRTVKCVLASLPRSGRLKVCNPSNSEEDLSERWDGDPSAYDVFVEGMIALHDSLGSLRSARGILPIKKILGELFGEKLAETVINEQARDVEQERQGGRLRVATISGSLTSVTGSGTAPIRRNTFYGN